MAARVFAEHEFVGRNTHGFWRHDLVAQRIADHTVLMYAGFVREGVTPDDGFVRLNAEADDPREQLAGRINLASVDSGLKSESIAAHVQCHHDLFQRCVARALADAVNSALDLTCTCVDGGETVRHREAEIVMTVDANRDVFSIANDTLADRAHKSREFIGE